MEIEHRIECARDNFAQQRKLLQKKIATSNRGFHKEVIHGAKAVQKFRNINLSVVYNRSEIYKLSSIYNRFLT